jgi:hypothetical protein
MPLHESVTDEYVAGLQAGFLAAAERVNAAPSWPETQKHMVAGTYPHLFAMGRAKEGWTKEKIARELSIRTVTGRLSGPINVIGGEQPEE